MKYKEQGGGSSVGLADSFTSFLQNGLQTGSFGSAGASSQYGAADPITNTNGIAGVLNDLLAGGGGKAGGATAQLLERQQSRDVNALRSRFSVGGGTAFGTPAAYAESQYRAEAAPQITQAISGMQMQALQSILPYIMGISQKGIAQRQGTFEQNPWVQAASVAAPIAGALLGGPAGAMLGQGLGSALSGSGGGGFSPNINAGANLDLSHSFSMPSMMPAPAASSYSFTPDWRYR